MPKNTWGKRGETLFPDEVTSISPLDMNDDCKAWYSVPSPKLELDEDGNPNANMKEFLNELKRRNKYHEERRRLLGREEGQEIE